MSESFGLCSAQVGFDLGKLLQRRPQILDDLGGNDVGRREVVVGFQAFVFEPEDVEAGLIACEDLVELVRAPTAIRVLFGPGGAALVDVPSLVAGNELVEVGALEALRLEGEMDICA